MPPTTVEIYDTTLRDGTQSEGLSPSVADKLKIARLVDRLGVHYIEGGWPGASPKDDEFFAVAKGELRLERATLVAFGSTRRPRRRAEQDPQLLQLLEADTEVVCIVGKAWNRHVREALRVSLAEGIKMVEDSIRLMRAHDRRVFFDAEHFFDGYRDEKSFSMAVLEAALAAGAERLVLCDTNGGTLPDQAEQVVRQVRTDLADSAEAAIGVHFHNDGGCAVANSLTAVRAGAIQVQGCMNGYGERTGNADLCTLIPNLVLKMGLQAIPPERLARLTGIAHHVAEIMNVPIEARNPYVGASAFAHKAGLHTSGLARLASAYEHVDPGTVGNSARLLVSELMGRSAVLEVSRHNGWDIDADTAQTVVNRVKELEHRGYYFEAADGSFELLVRQAGGWTQDFFTVEGFHASVSRRPSDNVTAEARVSLVVDGCQVTASQVGDGPVNALDRALRTALIDRYPNIDEIRLTDFRVQDLDTLDGTAARVRVLVQFADGVSAWGTVGVDNNIIEASWEALVDGLVVGLLRNAERTVAASRG